MKIFVDENIPFITVKELHSKGFEVIDIRGTQEEAAGQPSISCDMMSRNRMCLYLQGKKRPFFCEK